MAFIRGVVPEHLEREVTATPAEFERDLRKAWPAGVDMVAAGHFRIRFQMTCLDIQIAARGVRRLGLFELPVLCARYSFTGDDEAERRTLLALLDRAMQRGGG